MKKTGINITAKSLLLACLLLFAAGCSPKDPADLTFPALEFNPPTPTIVNVKKGIDIYYLEDHEIPTVAVDIILKTGSLYDPRGKEGLASLALKLLRSGGTESLSPGQLDETLALSGSTITVNGQLEYATVSMWTLRKHFKHTWAALLDLLAHPRFDRDRFEAEKQKELEVIRRRWDNPTMIGFDLFNELVYGESFPEARRPTNKSMRAITLQDVKAFYNDHIRDAQIIIALSGDFDPHETIESIGNDFKNWQPGAPKELALPKAVLAAKPGLYFIDKEDLSQAVICMGHLGINRLDPDNAEINILNFIYGTGSFNSRLVKEIRGRRHLAYMVFGRVDKGRDQGTFFNFCMTRNEAVGMAVASMIDVMEHFTRQPVSKAELATAVRYEQNSFVHLYELAHRLLVWKIIYKLYDYPDDYLETYLRRIEKIDEKKILEMAKRTIRPDRLIILVIGKKSAIYPQLQNSGFGEIHEISLPKDREG